MEHFTQTNVFARIRTVFAHLIIVCVIRYPKIGNLRYVYIYIYIYIRDETILQYIDILQYLLLQYNTIWLKGNIDILHIAIYCDILQYIAMFVVLMI